MNVSKRSDGTYILVPANDESIIIEWTGLAVFANLIEKVLQQRRQQKRVVEDEELIKDIKELPQSDREFIVNEVARRKNL